MKEFFVAIFRKIKERVRSLSTRSGIIALLLCGVCYGISFGQMLLPISMELKGALWVIFFGLAKTFQYGAILILGKAGIKAILRRK